MRLFRFCFFSLVLLMVPNVPVYADYDSPEEMRAILEDPWLDLGFPPAYSRSEDYPFSFYVSQQKAGEIFQVPVIVDLSFYDPRLCVSVPSYLRGVGWINPRSNCGNPATWWMMRSGESVLDGCDGGSCYGISAACPTAITVLDGEHVPAQVFVSGMGTRHCYDTGGKIRLSGRSYERGWVIPRMRIDILVDLRLGLPEEISGSREAILTLDRQQLYALAEALG